jgi:hypothetical protein
VNLIGHASGAGMTVGGNFINTGTLGVDDYDFFFSSGGSTLTISGTLTNTGYLQLGNDYRGSVDTTAPVTLTTHALNNTGSILLEGRSGAQATLNVTAGAAPSTLTGSIHLRGTSLLEFASGGIGTVAASGSVIVEGANSFVADSGQTSSDSALTGLSSNAGRVEFDNGSTLTITPVGGTFANSGSFVLEGLPQWAERDRLGGFLNTAISRLTTFRSAAAPSSSRHADRQDQVGGDYRGGIGTGARQPHPQGSARSILVEVSRRAGHAQRRRRRRALDADRRINGGTAPRIRQRQVTAVAASAALPSRVNAFIADSGQTSSDARSRAFITPSRLDPAARHHHPRGGHRCQFGLVRP